MYPYAAVETALMRVADVREEFRLALRARINYFRRIGLLAATPGKGSRIAYAEDDILLLALCVEFGQFGIEPKRAALLGRHLWKKVHPHLREGDAARDSFLAAFPMMVTAALMEAQADATEIFGGLLPLDEDPANWIVTATQVPDLLGDRASLINLSSLGRRVRAALSVSDRS